MANNLSQRRILILALVLNGTMFVVGLAAGLFGQSNGLIADSLDMFADAAAYGIALMAESRGLVFKARAARLSGLLLLILGLGALIDAARRGLVGSAPDSALMMAAASLSLIANLYVFHLLGRVRTEGVHLNAAWLFTRADVVANIGVIGSGAILALTGFRYIDVVAGSLIALYILKESFEILKGSSQDASNATCI